VAQSKQSKRERKEPSGDGRSRWIVLGAIAVVAVVLAGGLIVISQRSGEGDAPDVEQVATGDVAELDTVTARFDGIPQEGAVLGDPAAPVTITEFADLRCPACQSFATDQLPTVVDDLVRPGKAKYELIIWPILGPDSVTAMQAGIAAQQQNKLHEYADLWYYNQQSEGDTYATAEFTEGLASALGLDLDAFRTARDDEALWAPILQDTQVVTAQRGFGGTPSFLITGPGGERVISGQVPTAATIAQAVDEVS
jgi:protein-disulfide isomerase